MLAKGIALGLGVPVILVFTLEAVALGPRPTTARGHAWRCGTRAAAVYAAAPRCEPRPPLQLILAALLRPLNDVLSRLPTP